MEIRQPLLNDEKEKKRMALNKNRNTIKNQILKHVLIHFRNDILAIWLCGAQFHNANIKASPLQLCCKTFGSKIQLYFKTYCICKYVHSYNK